MALPRRSLPVFAMLVAAAALVLPAQAQQAGAPPLTATGDALVLDALGHSLKLPFPDWLSDDERGAGDVTPLVDATYQVSDERQALLEIFPKGETKAAWKTLYGARISLGAGRALTDYRRLMMLNYSQNCKPELVGFFQLGQDEGDMLAPLGFVCGAYFDGLPGFAGDGEVVVMSFRKSDTGVAVVYQEWRGAAFNPADPKTWPVETSVVEARARQLQAEAALALAD